MEIISNTTEFYLNRETAAAVGKFDGIHIGHRRLLSEVLDRKKEGLTAAVFTFEPAPAVFFGSSDGKELTTREEKRILFERMGVDVLIEYPLNSLTANMRPEDFVRQVLADRMKVRYIAAGSDLSFGAGGAGDGRLLCAMGEELGYSVCMIDKVRFGDQEVSSTYVRSQVEAGNMLLAGQLLGMPYTIMGKVCHGNRIGSTHLDMPTVNLLPGPDKLLPPRGVYFSSVTYGNQRYRAISNVGYKPTVAQKAELGVESYLYDFHEDIYGEHIEVSLHEFKRPEQKFNGLEELKTKLREDIRAGAVWSRQC